MVLSYLNTEDPEDDEEGTADEDDVADGLERGEESLHDELEAGRAVDDAERPERAHETEDA